jgi:hypothetical protein
VALGRQNIEVASVPTWLAILAPVVAAAIAASTALAGTLIGSRSAARSTEISALLVSRDESRRWNRERRERSYVTFLEARNRLIQTMERAFDRLEAESDPDLSAEVQAQFAALDEVSAALANVELFGSRQAVAAARRWAEDLRVWGEQRPPTAADFPDVSAQWKEAFRTEETEHRDPFLELTRRDLGIDD